MVAEDAAGQDEKSPSGDGVGEDTGTIVLIPARMASTRLPGKPLAMIGDRPMIVHVAERAGAAGIGRVVVATDTREVADAVEAHGYEAVMTRADHESGSDRIFEALTALDPDRKIGVVVNVQGDLPTVEPEVIAAAIAPLDDPSVDIATLCTEIAEDEQRTNPNVVKVVGSPVAGHAGRGGSPARLRALYFTRAAAPHGEGPLYHHIGLYAYRRSALERFVALPPSTLERREKLEQLRALEAGMRIMVAVVDSVPLGVDTPEDLERARAMLAPPERAGKAAKAKPA